jgi:hypothetical protein
MRVTATHRGFYLKLRDPGSDPFDIPDALFSAKWMQRVEEPETVPVELATVEAEQAPAVVESVAVEAPLVTEAAPAEPVVKKRRGRKPRVVSE